MAAAKKTAVATESPLRPVSYQGETINVDDKKLTTWRAFELIAAITDESSTEFARINAIFALIEYATDTTKNAIVDKCGGDEANPNDVITYALGIVTAIAPKN